MTMTREQFEDAAAIAMFACATNEDPPMKVWDLAHMLADERDRRRPIQERGDYIAFKAGLSVEELVRRYRRWEDVDPAPDPEAPWVPEVGDRVEYLHAEYGVGLVIAVGVGAAEVKWDNSDYDTAWYPFARLRPETPKRTPPEPEPAGDEDIECADFEGRGPYCLACNGNRADHAEAPPGDPQPAESFPLIPMIELNSPIRLASTFKNIVGAASGETLLAYACRSLYLYRKAGMDEVIITTRVGRLPQHSSDIWDRIAEVVRPSNTYIAGKSFDWLPGTLENDDEPYDFTNSYAWASLIRDAARATDGFGSTFIIDCETSLILWWHGKEEIDPRTLGRSIREAIVPVIRSHPDFRLQVYGPTIYTGHDEFRTVDEQRAMIGAIVAGGRFGGKSYVSVTLGQRGTPKRMADDTFSRYYRSQAQIDPEGWTFGYTSTDQKDDVNARRWTPDDIGKFFQKGNCSRGILYPSIAQFYAVGEAMATSIRDTWPDAKIARKVARLVKETESI